MFARGATVLSVAWARPVATAYPQAATQASALVIDGATVVDVATGKLVAAQRVVVAGNHIQSVGSARRVPLPAGAQVVDARGKYLIPGLWDMHVHPAHAAPLLYPLFLANGVTGIRDAGTDVPLDTLKLWRREILAGTRIGPPRQILSSRSIDGPCRGEQFVYHICVADSADARHRVDSFKTAGADMIKMYGLSPAMYFVVAAEARRIGIPFGGHATAKDLTAIEASDSGASIIDHSIASGEIGVRCFNPETASVKQCQRIADRFRRNGTWWVPTLVANFDIGTRSIPAIEHLARVGRAFWPESFGPDSAQLASVLGDLQRASQSGGTRLLSIAHRVGLPILMGTDATIGSFHMVLHPEGFSIHGELEMDVAQGLSPLEALQAATLNPAKMLRGTDSLGTVTAGKLADLVLLDADPLADITNTTAIRAVVANGRYFDRDVLDRLLAEVRANAGQLPEH